MIGGVSFNTDFDIGNIIAGAVAVGALYGAGRRWTGKIEDKFQEIVVRLTKVEDKQTDQASTLKVLSHEAETIKTQLTNQSVVMVRMETSVVDPLRRFATLESEHSELMKEIVKLGTHQQDLEKRLEEQRDEIKGLRQRVHDMTNAAQVKANTDSMASLRNNTQS